MDSTILKGTMQKAGEAVSGAFSNNKKTSDLKHNMKAEATSSDHATSDFGVKIPSQDIWLSASTGDRKGPQLLEDNFGREKVCRYLWHCGAKY